MKLSYFGGGLLNTSGFGYAKEREFVRYKFARNSYAYMRRKAEIGVLERVFIDKVILKSTVKTFHKHVPMYIDNLKTMYDEIELVTYEDAQNLIESNIYLTSLQDHRQNKQKEIKKNVISNRFAANDICFSKPAAIMGKMEKVIILKPLNDYEIYMDKFHSLWSKDDLIVEAEAKSLALKYWEEKKEFILVEIRKQDGGYIE